MQMQPVVFHLLHSHYPQVTLLSGYFYLPSYKVLTLSQLVLCELL